MDNSTIVTRFAPSPTGFLHIGGARSALFNYAFAKQNKGKIILRIEDTDKERSKPEHTECIKRGFDWLGLKFDAFYLQSDNAPIHRKYIEKMIAEGKAYVSKETPKKEGDRSEVIRFRNPNKKVVVDDMIRGPVEFDTTELGDFVIAKDLNEPIFHLSNVVDDLEMGITHVIRGEEHLSNTPRQILIWEAITDKPRMKYAHIPLILSETREKISKRKHGEIVSIEYYQKEGYLPEAILNFLALLGWNPGNDVEILSLDEIIKQFDITKVQKSGAIFNMVKLKWFNKEYLKKLPIADIENAIVSALKECQPTIQINPALVQKIAPLLLERVDTLGDFKNIFKTGEFMYFFSKPAYEPSALLWKDEKDPKAAKAHLEFVVSQLSTLSDANFTAEKIKELIWNYATEKGRGNVLWPMRFALSGVQKSPDPFTLSAVLGKQETLDRLTNAINSL